MTFVKIVLLLVVLGLIAVLWLIRVIRGRFREFVTDVATQMAIESQPRTIRLIRDRQLAWRDRDAVARQVGPLRALGFRAIGSFRVEELPDVRLAGLGHPEEGYGAAVYELQESGKVYTDVVARYEDGDLLTVSNASLPMVLTPPPFALKIDLRKANAAKLLRALEKNLEPKPLMAIDPTSFSRIFEEAWEREETWRREESPEVVGGQEYADLMADLPFADEATAARLGVDAETLRFIAARTEADVRVLTLEGYPPAGSIAADQFAGKVEPDPEQPDAEKVSMEVLAVLVSDLRVDDLVRALQDQLTPRGVQCLLTGRGAKDFVYLFGTGLMPASRFAAGKALLVVFRGAVPDPLLWVRQTNAANYDLGTAAILAKLKEWEPLCGVRLIGAGFDWVWLDLVRLPADLEAFARDAVDFCADLLPELVDEDELEEEDEDGGAYEATGVAALVERLRQEPSLVLWWD
ncbi:MAG TPA: DUF4253 domain-containing protein [Thermoanaerobaculia bacterium]